MSTATVLITGNTYPVKDRLKELGAKWDANSKGWRVPADKQQEANAIVAGAGSAKPGRSGKYHPTKCIACGCTEYRNSRGYVENKILKSGECVACYEERKMGY